MTRCIVAALVLLTAAASGSGEEILRLTVSAPEAGGTNVPVSVKIEMIKELAKAPGENIAVKLVCNDGEKPVEVVGQIVKARGKSAAELWWVIPTLEGDDESIWIAEFKDTKRRIKSGFVWEDHAGKQLDLLFDGRPVLRYMYAHDTSSRMRTRATYKPFHHFFGSEGKQLITSGGERGAKFPEQRGLFVGFTVGRHDLWGMAESRQPTGTAQVHARHVEVAGGPVVARHTAIIHWNGQKGATIKKLIEETRSVTVYRSESPTLLQLQIDTTLKSLAGDLTLRGDSEHAGLHIRAHNDLARGDLKTAEGEWHSRIAKYTFAEGKKSDREIGMPWAMMNYVIKGKQYNVQLINAPGAGGKGRFSANRPYGRLGACPYAGRSVKLSAKTLKLSYRIFVDAGDPPVGTVLEARHAAFGEKLEVEAKWIYKAPVWE